VDWELRLRDAGEIGAARLAGDPAGRLPPRFCQWVWTSTETGSGAEDRPPLSVDLVPQFLARCSAKTATFFIVIDCLRLDQWRSLLPLTGAGRAGGGGAVLLHPPHGDALLAQRDLLRDVPGRYRALASPAGGAGGGGQPERVRGRALPRADPRAWGAGVPVHYEKVFSAGDGEQMLHRLPALLSQPGVTALVFNFVDMLTHGRSESAVLLEVARDKEALRALTRQWFERSEALAADPRGDPRRGCRCW
jgi:hypothetical protein